jgi:hypothetical protein
MVQIVHQVDVVVVPMLHDVNDQILIYIKIIQNISKNFIYLKVCRVRGS